MTYIYGLADPRSYKIRYIGHSNNPLKRLGEHINETAQTAKGKWIAELKGLNLTPLLIILEVVEVESSVYTSEAWWVEFGKNTGWPLTNGNQNYRQSKKAVDTLRHIRSMQLILLNFAYMLLRDANRHDIIRLQGQRTHEKPISELNLFDLIELFCSWSATAPYKGGVQKVLDMKRKDLGNKLYRVLTNTVAKFLSTKDGGS